MKTFKKFFLLPTIITLISLILTFCFGNIEMLFAVIILIVLEVTLSFDKAVVNAKVLEKMDSVWQKRFINWGIWLAVFGTRIILPIIIVEIVASMGFLEVLNLAIYNPEIYGLKLHEAHYSIGAFGGAFLLLVALKYFIDHNKEIHWIKSLEKSMKKFANIESIEISFALIVLVIVSKFVGIHADEVLVAGIVGIVLFVIMHGVTATMQNSFVTDSAKTVAAAGFTMFIYLNILDSAFSLDGVIGAFAISKNLFVIGVGLGIGAYFVRSFTLMLVELKTLNELKYLEHGAHWAIFGLAICMLLGLIINIPELIIGSIGLLFVAASYYSSYRIKEN